MKETIKKSLIGGEFLIDNFSSDQVFIIEDFDEDQKMMAEACQDFIKREIHPHREAIENQQEGLMASRLKKAGDLGLLGICIPSKYGGLDMSFNTSICV